MEGETGIQKILYSTGKDEVCGLVKGAKTLQTGSKKTGHKYLGTYKPSRIEEWTKRMMIRRRHAPS